MDLLKRFGNLYNFPAEQVSYSDNFAELATKTRRLPGMHGGFDDLGNARGLSEIGSIRADFWLSFDNLTEATEKLDEFRRMSEYGVQLLHKTAQDGSKRWTWARVDNISTPQNVKDQPHKRMKASIIFQASDPFWYGIGSGVSIWGDGVSKWGGNVSTWGGATVTSVSGVLTTLSYNYTGNVFTQASISIVPGAGQSCTDPIVRRIVSGAVVDELRYYGTLAATERLFIDSRRASVRVNEVNAYDARFDTKSAYMLRLVPGANTIQVLFAQATDAASVCIRWPNRYV